MQRGRRTTPAKPKAAAAPKPEAFDVNKHIEKVEEVGFEELMLDVQQRMGQTRPVDMQHVEALVENFQANPPHMLEVTCWLDQSVFLALLPSASFVVFQHVNALKEGILVVFF